MNINAKITGVHYKPHLCSKLPNYCFSQFEDAMEKSTSFLLSDKQLACSWWVSSKRTRSYPYARIYNTLCFPGKKVMIIPIFKDEGKDGDRDYLQWDTISLMSLLGIYVIIGYYIDAKRNGKYKNKITKQRFDYKYLKSQIDRLSSYQSDALHWNLEQVENISDILKKAMKGYDDISKKLNVEMHSKKMLIKRINDLSRSKEGFMDTSRNLASRAQKRELLTIQPKEKLNGEKLGITIKNYLGGYYYFTCDEFKIFGDKIYLIEGKHTKRKNLPSIDDIKDALLKMVLYTNIKDITIGGKKFEPVPVVKLTTERQVGIRSMSDTERDIIKLLKREARENKFRLRLNNRFLV